MRRLYVRHVYICLQFWVGGGVKIRLDAASRRVAEGVTDKYRELWSIYRYVHFVNTQYSTFNEVHSD